MKEGEGILGQVVKITIENLGQKLLNKMLRGFNLIK